MSGNYVYVINRADGALKVGFSKNPDQRLASRRGFLGEAASVVFSLHRPLGDAHRVEKMAHKVLQAFDVGYEWFDVTPEMARSAVVYAGLLADNKRSVPKPAIYPTWGETLDPLSTALLIGYVRPLPGLTRGEQVVALRRRGVASENIYHDEVQCRDGWSASLKDVRKGDTFLIPRREMLGSTEAEVLLALSEIAKRGPVVVLLDG